MAHSPHERPGIVFADDCDECTIRAADPLAMIGSLDHVNRLIVGGMASAILHGHSLPEGASENDKRAAYRLADAWHAVDLYAVSGPRRS